MSEISGCFVVIDRLQNGESGTSASHRPLRLRRLQERGVRSVTAQPKQTGRTALASLKILHDTYILVGDGEKALILRNEGDEVNLNLVVDRVLEQDNPPTREQGTDRPGRFVDGLGPNRSAVEETDWHRLEKERFAKDIAARLYRRAHSGRFDRLIIIAPPRTLGDLRAEFHQEVRDRIIGEIGKDLTGHPIDSIENILTAA